MNIKFDSPEFYPQDTIVLTVPTANQGPILITNGGNREAIYNDQVLKSHDEWRDAFDDGVIRAKRDEFKWISDGWFAVYFNGEQMGIDFFSLTEAIDFALELTYG